MVEPMASKPRLRAKRAFERAAVGVGLDQAGAWIRRRNALVLAYHNVVPDGSSAAGDIGLHLPLAAFRAQLDYISQYFRVVSLTQMLSGTWRQASSTMAVALTFDDAYRGTLSLALPELERRGMPATFFVAPGILGDRTLWWDGLAATMDASLFSNSIRDRLLRDSDGTEEGVRALAAREALEMRGMGFYYRTATTSELTATLDDNLFTVASHTWSHGSLVRLSPTELVSELRRPMEWLNDLFPGRYVNAIAYPYGHHSLAVEIASARVGYEAGFGLSHSWIVDLPPRLLYRCPRLSVPAHISLDGFRLRMGWRRPALLRS
jgi:peptidoglycan/xylan/chitin deacetylase (PgdA/CDA1 family)